MFFLRSGSWAELTKRGGFCPPADLNCQSGICGSQRKKVCPFCWQNHVLQLYFLNCFVIGQQLGKREIPNYGLHVECPLEMLLSWPRSAAAELIGCLSSCLSWNCSPRIFLIYVKSIRSYLDLTRNHTNVFYRSVLTNTEPTLSFQCAGNRGLS